MTIEEQREVARSDVEAHRAEERAINWARRYRWREHLQRAYTHAALSPWLPWDSLVPSPVLN